MAMRMMMLFWVWYHADLSVDADILEKHTVFSHDDGGIMFLQNVVIFQQVYTVPKHRTAFIIK
jgi:hypothetical protein